MAPLSERGTGVPRSRQIPSPPSSVWNDCPLDDTADTDAAIGREALDSAVVGIDDGIPSVSAGLEHFDMYLDAILPWFDGSSAQDCFDFSTSRSNWPEVWPLENDQTSVFPGFPADPFATLGIFRWPISTAVSTPASPTSPTAHQDGPMHFSSTDFPSQDLTTASVYSPLPPPSTTSSPASFLLAPLTPTAQISASSPASSGESKHFVCDVAHCRGRFESYKRLLYVRRSVSYLLIIQGLSDAIARLTVST